MNTVNWSSRQALIKLFPLIISISFAMDVYVPAMPAMSHYFHVSIERMQASLYLFMLTVAVTQLFVGPLADLWGRRMTTLVTALMFLLGSIICALADSMNILLVGRMVQAMGACGTYLMCFIIVRDNFSTQDCGRLFSLLGGVNSVIASSAPVIGGLLLDITHDWRSGFDFLSVLGLLILLAAIINIPQYRCGFSIKPLHNKSQILSAILYNPYFLKYTLIASACLLGLYLFCALSPEILINQLQLSGFHYGLWFGLNAVTVFIANFIAARLIDHYSLEKIVSTGLLIMIIACLVMMTVSVYRISVLTFMLPMLAMTVGIGLSMGCAIALALKDFTESAGIATSIVSACQFAVSGLIGIIVAQFSMTPWGLAIPVFLLASSGLVLVHIRQSPHCSLK